MIKSIDHAKAVQKRRVESGKRGYAHAVRRYCNRTGFGLRDLPVIPRMEDRP